MTTIYSVWCEEYEDHCFTCERLGMEAGTLEHFIEQRAKIQTNIDVMTDSLVINQLRDLNRELPDAAYMH